MDEALNQLTEEKRQAELDKIAAIRALEEKSKEFLKEKDENARLESKLKMIHYQVGNENTNIEETPQFRNLLEEKQKEIRNIYEEKVKQLENERLQMEEGKNQVEKCKQLLIKQRDIMIALTARLNDRDEIILELQEELDLLLRLKSESEITDAKKSEKINELEALLNKTQNLYQNSEKNSTVQISSEEKKFIPFPDEVIKDSNNLVNKNSLNTNEKIQELENIIIAQKSIIKKYESNSSNNSKVLQDSIKSLNLKNSNEEKNESDISISNISSNIEKTAIPGVSKVLKFLKEQKDQFRLFKVIQELEKVHGSLNDVSKKIKKGDN